jgi:guanosine-diphosphatase
VSLPTKHVVRDPHEKPDRYRIDYSSSGLIGRMKDSWMSQSQKTRWIKTAAIVFTIVTLFYWFSPKGVEIHHEGVAGMTAVRNSLMFDL